MICSTCKIEKTIDHFEWRSDTNKRRAQCRKCHKGYELLKGQFKQRIVDGKKQCGKCKNIKPVANFHVDKNTSTGLTSWCSSCKGNYQQEKREYISAKTASVRYGIPTTEVMKIRARSKCEICDKSIDGTQRRAIDHCHKTGRVRGALCSACNYGIGHLRDDVTILKNAINYINKYNQL